MTWTQVVKSTSKCFSCKNTATAYDVTFLALKTEMQFYSDKHAIKIQHIIRPFYSSAPLNLALTDFLGHFVQFTPFPVRTDWLGNRPIRGIFQ